jgi:hypothetical protein
LQQADNREHKRYLEKQNKAARKKRKTEDNARIIRLVDTAVQCDPRLKLFKVGFSYFFVISVLVIIKRIVAVADVFLVHFFWCTGGREEEQECSQEREGGGGPGQKGSRSEEKGRGKSGGTQGRGREKGGKGNGKEGKGGQEEQGME